MKLRTLIFITLLGVMGSLSAHTAHWITADHALRNAPNTWIEFRKTLTLSESPQEALAHTSDAEVTAAAKGIVSVTYATDTATVVVGSGHYRIFVPIPAVIAEVGVGN